MDAIWQLERQLIDRISTLSGVQSAAGLPNFPLETGWNMPVAQAGVAVAIVNASLAKQFFANGDALGKRIEIGDGAGARWHGVRAARDHSRCARNAVARSRGGTK